MKEKIKKFMKALKEMPDFDKVKFVILFGSFSRNNENKLSDIDFAVYYDGDKKERFNFRKIILSKLPNNYDVQLFQDLPLYIRIEVLKGKIIYCADEDYIYNIFYETIRNFEDFKDMYYDYIERRQIIC